MSDKYGFSLKVSPALAAARRHAIEEFIPIKKVIKEGIHTSAVGSFLAENKSMIPRTR